MDHKKTDELIEEWIKEVKILRTSMNLTINILGKYKMLPPSEMTHFMQTHTRIKELVKNIYELQSLKTIIDRQETEKEEEKIK
jgi:hypothetical protein